MLLYYFSAGDAKMYTEIAAAAAADSDHGV